MSVLTIERQRIGIATIIYNMRQSGATLQQIADRIGRTKERVRQILIENYGTTKHKLISTEQLCQLSGYSRNRIMELYQDNAIIPIVEWDRGNRHFALWSLSAAEQVNIHYKTHRLCKMCYSFIPKGRLVYCSEQCYNKSRKYKYKSVEAKQRHLRNIKRY